MFFGINLCIEGIILYGNNVNKYLAKRHNFLSVIWFMLPKCINSNYDAKRITLRSQHLDS